LEALEPRLLLSAEPMTVVVAPATDAPAGFEVAENLPASADWQASQAAQNGNAFYQPESGFETHFASLPDLDLAQLETTKNALAESILPVPERGLVEDATQETVTAAEPGPIPETENLVVLRGSKEAENATVVPADGVTVEIQAAVTVGDQAEVTEIDGRGWAEETVVDWSALVPMGADEILPENDGGTLEATSHDGHADKALELVETLAAANAPPHENADFWDNSTSTEPNSALDPLQTGGEEERVSTAFEYQISSILPSHLTLKISQINGLDYLLLFDESNLVRASQDLASTTEVRILGSDQDDKLTVDFSTPFSLPIYYDGGDQTSETGDILEIIGDGTTPGSYSPHPTDSDKGIIEVGDSVITFAGLEPVTESNLASFTFTTTGSADVITIDSLAPGQNRISGTSDGVRWECPRCSPSGSSNTCPTCWPATCRSCTTPRGRTTRLPKTTWPACWPWARPFASSNETRRTFSWLAGPKAGSTR
jgi:hypothetical protein